MLIRVLKLPLLCHHFLCLELFDDINSENGHAPEGSMDSRLEFSLEMTWKHEKSFEPVWIKCQISSYFTFYFLTPFPSVCCSFRTDHGLSGMPLSGPVVLMVAGGHWEGLEV